MKDFLALVRDTLPIKNPVGTWQLGKNMILTKGVKSIANEDGNKFIHLVPGTVIGFITTTQHVVYFSKNNDGTDEVGIININDASPSYTTKVKTNLFNFQYNCPIEGVFIYNYKGELIISWCDGIRANSNTPKILNLTTPFINLNGDGTLVDDAEFNKVHLFPHTTEANLTLEYLEGGNIDGYAAYITYAYILDDTSALPYFGSSVLAYLGKGYDLTDKQGVKVILDGLDTNFNKLKLGIVLKKDGSLFGYESYDIDYTGTTKEIDVTDLSGYSATSAENIVLEKEVFAKIKSMTKQDSQIIVGNTEQEEKLNIQQYANMLTLTPFRHLSTNPQIPSLMPDEVYSFYIEVQDKKTGKWSDGFHIPGRVAEGTELDDITAQQGTDYGLGWAIAKDMKQFHIFNNGSVTTNVATDKMGYWENEETYPDIDDFNSTGLGGSDLRNTPIRYHRMPSIRSSHESGETEEYYKIGVQVDNFATVMPPAILDKIQAYRISFIKRNNGNNYVAGNWIMTRRGESTAVQSGITLQWEFHDLLNTESNFGKARVLGIELSKFKPTLDVSHIIANYEKNVIGGNIWSIPTASIYAETENTLKYAPANNIAAKTLYLEEGVNMDMASGTYMDTMNSPSSALNITAFSHKKNVYSGFKSNDLVILERTTDLTNETRLKGGDVFNLTEINRGLYTVQSNLTTRTQTKVLLNWKGLFSPVNSIKVESDAIYDNEAKTISHDDPNEIDTEILSNRDYTIQLIHEEDLSSINDIQTILTHRYDNRFVTRFPYRVSRGIKIGNETFNTESLRTFLVNDYYEMPNDKGEIIAVRGKNRALFIQHRFALFTAVIKDKLVTQNVDAYLGRPDLFERPPEEVISDEQGYIGSTSQFACVIIKGMYITVNQITGQIFILKDGVQEISANGNKNWFWNNWDNGLDFYELDVNGEKRRIDNPYISVGHIIGYDKEFNRLLFTKKAYEFIGNPIGASFDGEFYSRFGTKLEFSNTTEFKDLSRTLSYSLEGNGSWAFEHDYKPNFMFHSSRQLYSGINKLNGTDRCSIYEHNDSENKGLFYGTKYKSYVDIIFNGRPDVSKIYQTITWITDTLNLSNGNEYHKTITHIMIYNNHQCSGIISVKDGDFDITRNSEGDWSFNEFRDLVINSNIPIIDDNGELITSNINNDKIWFEKSNFISKFIVVRFIIDNVDNDTVYLHDVKAKSIISKR